MPKQITREMLEAAQAERAGNRRSGPKNPELVGVRLTGPFALLVRERAATEGKSLQQVIEDALLVGTS